ncbi:hypothetical protein P20311_0407 [Pseudoalteromonas sp. BSi20311]|nr:hypothetical protein P20311_0407 [Pseudoalteromonas sp. BSi20311]GAA71539.1 hypothetical protein P20439_1613 [Pseudoalteromonas sp. BSi20439]
MGYLLSAAGECFYHYLKINHRATLICNNLYFARSLIKKNA